MSFKNLPFQQLITIWTYLSDEWQRHEDSDDGIGDVQNMLSDMIQTLSEYMGIHYYDELKNIHPHMSDAMEAQFQYLFS